MRYRLKDILDQFYCLQNTLMTDARSTDSRQIYHTFEQHRENHKNAIEFLELVGPVLFQVFNVEEKDSYSLAIDVEPSGNVQLSIVNETADFEDTPEGHH